MPKHYAYRMNSDRGFAPNVKYGICTLSGCKPVIESHAEKGSWVIGIGGNKTTKPNKMIYAMEVQDNLLYSQFKKQYPGKSRYLQVGNAGSNVLLSRKFHYFGDKAIDLPKDLGNITIDRQGCKCISDEDIANLEKYLAERYFYGKIGEPNNSKKHKKCKGKVKQKNWLNHCINEMNRGIRDSYKNV